ncbi:transcriptional regulator GlxA family with amidase domain [Microbacterium terrae]|uniref:HTH-type transcriptional regulator CdhR n=1 Tax=Microbacterium terrae TaxID=69369 RepID=A0A0M2H4X6_9MICO|nr:helix-turn-helix domain-containing protein [Microbacterium terrae]KJL38792.1 HTH-type transcriptional regulator CdhR [Microbacterium terrae]MBP1076211.1 transcriptional regulator GlxA family with amidase domain [Microbacterium terrae]GLJ97032.1 AraC family transcriptional regulator [Microbacterium terrae]
MTDRTLDVSVVALPDTGVATMFGVLDVLNSFSIMGLGGTDAPPPFRAQIVGAQAGPLMGVSGIPVPVAHAIADIATTDIVIVPSIVLGSSGWQSGRYPELVDWATRMHAQGAMLASACSGIFLLAETGRFDGHDVTVHYDYATQLRTAHPEVRVHPERALMVAGTREELVTSGASTTWHDLVLYLTGRYAGAALAQETARMFALQWHQDGLAPYMMFEGRTDHGDAVVADAQDWLRTHFSVATPVEQMVVRSGLAERTFKRRFTESTGVSPLVYVQRIRVEEAKRRLERSEDSVEAVGWHVGYEDSAFFRRLFKRVTGLAPGAYRKRFRVPRIAPAPAPD